MHRLVSTAIAATLLMLAFAAHDTSVRATESDSQRLAQLRARFAAEPRVKEAREAVEAAERAIATKLAEDPAIARARQAEQAAREAVAKAEQSAADADTRVQEHRAALAAARSRDADLDLQRRMEEMRAEHLRNEVRSSPELRDLWSRVHLHPHHPDLLKADPRLAAARRRMDEANAALEKKVRELPEQKASEQARKEFEQAVAASKALKDVEADRRAIEEKVAENDRVATQVARVKAAGDAQAAQRRVIAELDQNIREASGRAAAADPDVAKARQVVATAQANVARTIQDRIAGEQKARDAAHSSWRQELDAVIAANPEARDLEREMRILEERLQAVRTRLGELRRPVTP